VKISQVVSLLEERGMPNPTRAMLLKILQQAPENLTDLDSDEVKSDYDEVLAMRNMLKAEGLDFSIG